MRTAKYLSAGLILLLGATVSASDYDIQPPGQDLSLLARLSYQNSRIQHRDAMQNTHICLLVYIDGHYRALRTNEEGTTQMQEGKLTHDQLNELQFLLNTDAFRHLEGTRGALIRESAESFIAEVPRNNYVQRVSLMIADETRHFPKSAERVVEWLMDFTPVNAKSVERSEFPDVCPTMQVSGVQPVAENFGLSSNGSCAVVDRVR